MAPKLTAAEKSKLYVVDFFDGLIDGHDFIAEQLSDKSIHTYNGEFYEGSLNRIPEPLARYLDIDLHKYPEQGEVTTSLGFSIDPNRAKKFSLDFLLLQPADRESLLLAYDGESTKLSSHNEELFSFIGSSLMSQTIHALMPEYSHIEEVDDEQVAKAIFELSPNHWHTATLEDKNVSLTVSDSESDHDSSKKIDLQVKRQHVCGKGYIFETSTEHTITKAIKGIGTDKSLIFSDERRVMFNEFEVGPHGKTINVVEPRKFHAETLRKAVEALLRKSLMGQPSKGTPWSKR